MADSREREAPQNTRKPPDIPTLSTGSLLIDAALGIGGVPKGHIVEISGTPASGKTTFCLSVIAQAQRNGGCAAFIDIEHALDVRYAQSIGVILSELLFSQPDTGEDALNIAEKLIQSNLLDVLVIDSMAELVPRQALEGQPGYPLIGAKARFFGQPLNRLAEAVRGTDCICLLTNQIHETIAVVRDDPEMTVGGGRTLASLSSIRLEMNRLRAIKNLARQDIGHRSQVTVLKNSLAPPAPDCEIDVLYDQGISREGEIIDLGIRHGLVDNAGGWYSYKGQRIGFGKENARNFFIANEEAARELQNECCTRLPED